MSWRHHNLVFILGAGASKPLGISTSKEIVKEFLETGSAKPLANFEELILKEEWDIEKLLRLIQRVKTLGQEPPLESLLEKKYTKTLENKIRQLNKTYGAIYEPLLKFIRNCCLKPDLEKAVEIYEPLLELRKKATIKIFTTNYDTAVENVCRKLRIRHYDGFTFDPFDEYWEFHPGALGIGNPQLYKLHGSVDWWTDIRRQEIFRLGLNLEGVGNLRTMMIYPAEVESAFDYPYNILQSHYILALMNASEIIAIGHRFGDINISLPIKALLEKPNFKLTLVAGSSTEEIKKEVFGNHKNVETVPEKIENWIVEGIKKVEKQVDAFEKERQKKRKEAAKRAKKEREELRAELEQEQRDKEQMRPISVPASGSVLSSLNIQPSDLLVPLKRFCPECNAEIWTNSSTCPSCGSELKILL